LSEYSYYSFRGGHELAEVRPKSPTFQQWLDENFATSGFVVADFPTIDLQPIEDGELTNICDQIHMLLRKPVNVLIVDSGGFTRTGAVCAALVAEDEDYVR
jgi:protein-tyrosine phosphatase